MSLSNAKINLLNQSGYASVKSNLNYKHGCVISKGKRK